jgi:hypothetical protein
MTEYVFDSDDTNLIGKEVINGYGKSEACDKRGKSNIESVPKADGKTSEKRKRSKIWVRAVKY